MAVYQCTKFLLIPFYTPDKLFIAKIKKGSNSVKTVDTVIVLAFCDSLHSPLSMYKFHLFIFNTFRDILCTSLLLQKLEREITQITDRFTVLALCTSIDGRRQCIKFHLTLFHTFRDTFTANIKKRNNWVNTGDRVMALAF